MKAVESLRSQRDQIQLIAQTMVRVFQRGGVVYLCGNGGSASDAQHIAAELIGKLSMNRVPLPAIALTTNTSVITAVANDFSFEDVFVRQVQALVTERDMLVGISTSGESRNVIQALAEARRKGAATAAMTGSGGEMGKHADIVLSIPSRLTPRIQEAHITAGHIICDLVEQIMFANRGTGDE
ncbi:SIS domain-containing protein [Heliobacillus mobilis]|uniref:SIS domain-containing protein n=2 Tax=Heliobacterium mobile TaxID=28064 RepID=A0A6I3SL75_HELMO|nr:SIS domain-containing protein [Heliobacterium mobile]